MIGAEKKNFIVAAFLVFFVGALLSSGCTQDSQSGDSGLGSQDIRIISTQEGYDLIQKNQGKTDFAIIDVRTPEEFTEGHIEGATNFDFYSPKFKDDLDKLDKGKTYVIYCRSGNRSGQSLAIFQELGFKKVLDFGGIIEWNNHGYPTVR